MKKNHGFVINVLVLLLFIFLASCSGKKLSPEGNNNDNDTFATTDNSVDDDNPLLLDSDIIYDDSDKDETLLDGDTLFDSDTISDSDELPDVDTFICPEKRMCKGSCCKENEMCHNDKCVADCDPISQLCGDALELCCPSTTVCYQGKTCVTLGIECTYTEECELDEYCEPTLHRCIPRDEGETCEYRPPVGDFSPHIGCLWTAPSGSNEAYSDVVMTPVVGNLTDDNGDGATDTLDSPDIAFISFNYKADGCCTSKGVLRIIDGRCKLDGTMTTIATIDTVWMDNSGGLVLANLDPPSELDKRNPEIVAVFKTGGTIAWKRTADDGSAWTEMWRQDTYLTANQTRQGTQPSVADVNADGLPEVIIGNVVLNGQTGALIWDGDVTSAAASIDGGVGNNSFLGPASAVADIDGDGIPEVIAGNSVYNGKTGAVKAHYTYTSSNSACGGALSCDGLVAIGNFDSDSEAEIVIVRRGEVFVLEHDMTLKHVFKIPIDDCANNESGPPTIADFDGDGEPEIGVAGADFYIVFDLECINDPLPAKCAEKNVLWKTANHDCSSRVTGSSVFDFDGDGRAEVVYADEQNFRIFDGTTGAILFDDPTHKSNTRMEMPVIADVDNDMKAEVLVPCAANDIGYGGLEVWDDSANNWVRTRRIWNQHTYHITNISEDGQVPTPEKANWLNSRLNNFRQNVLPAGMFDAPDLFVENILFDKCLFPEDEPVMAKFFITVANRGMLGVGPGVPVLVTLIEDLIETTAVAYTTTSILPGNNEELIVEVEITTPGTFFTLEVTVDMDDTGKQRYNECDETNNYKKGKRRDCFGSS